MIHTESLGKNFGDFVAVNDVSLDVANGEVLALLGPNGAGKTTTVRMLTSVLTPSRGKALVAGYDVVAFPNQVRGSVGVLTEHHGLYNRMNAEEYLQFYGSLYHLDPKAVNQRLEELLKKFGLFNDRRRRLGEYSKGMRQKLALVRALLHEPPVLLLDEPTSAMDPESARMVRDSIANLRSSDRTIILCTHNLVEAEELADQIAIIRKGAIIFQDTVTQLKRNLLGEPRFEARLAVPVKRWSANLPDGVQLVDRGETWLRFSVEDPHTNNPALLRTLINSGLDITSFEEVRQSLEEAYLEAVNRENHA